MNNLFRSARSSLAIGILSALYTSPVIGGLGEGLELYNSYCSVCHGEAGEGQAMGKSLNDRSANSLSDAEVLDVIKHGRSGTGMAGWGDSFDDGEILDIANHVRSLQGRSGIMLTERKALVDTPEIIAGRALFKGKGKCVTCHSYDDDGGSIGPALDDVAQRLSESELKEALLDPSAKVAKNYRAKKVTRSDGTIVVGRFRNESDRALQIQSEDGRRWITFFKDRVSSITNEESSLMPDVFSTLEKTEREEILAFLRAL
jgi:putative heme-binding domain-containing protein